MSNERLRTALLEHGLTPESLGERIGVDTKTVERWVAGRTPYRKHRYVVASQLGKDEAYLWPGALSREQVTAASDSEVLAIYPRRSDMPREVFEQVFDGAQHEIGVLVYAGLFLSEDTSLKKILAERARAGVRLRVLMGDPNSAQVAARGADEGIGDVVGLKIRNALALLKGLREIDGVEFRLHQTILYNSIYRGDDQLLVNTHVYGLPAAAAPVWHLKKVAGGEITSTYLESFERVWDTGVPVPGFM